MPKVATCYKTESAQHMHCQMIGCLICSVVWNKIGGGKGAGCGGGHFAIMYISFNVECCDNIFVS